ncbi:hypothetical protein SLITO_v1c10590 [Spiroplasma litorale]|uniref:Transmembrane protein n=1 Tax=Spiroplasma litorale TaxID=216942 RepID=A0A0K1W2W8_9MOLU|nr:hypothetical protein [Spiroplasma litorale]AKX34670.1 hypothetical protein SLITO_v1c10590 [Spiroplasma litorale]
MFSVFIISAWSIVIISSLALITFLTLSLILTLIAKVSVLMKIYDILSGHPYSSVVGDDSKFMVNLKNMSGKEIGAFIAIAVLMVIAISLIIISIIELVRLKKKQKISKPLIKGYLLVLIVVFMLLSQAILLIVAGTLVLGLIMLEFVLFDNDALNNYAEERNLISINKEERKFEREVAKEGKQNGNVTLKKQKSKLAKNKVERIKKIDKDALPNTDMKLDIKLRAKHERWKKQRDSLVSLREQILNSKNTTEEDVLNKLIKNFNFKVKKINGLAKKLSISDQYYIEYLVQDSFINEVIKNPSTFESIENIEVENTLEDAYKEYDENTKTIEEQLNIDTFTTQEINEFESVYPEFNPNGRFDQSLGDEFIKEKMARAINMDLSELKVNDDDNFKNDILDEIDFDQHGILTSIKDDYNKDENVDSNNANTFVRPETKLDTNSPSVNALGEKFVREKMARAINEDVEKLTESESNESIDTKNIFNDFNLNQSSNYDKFNQEEKLQKETKEQKVENIETTFVRPQTRLEENQSNTFVRPETKLDTNSPSVNALGEKFVREKMARAINMTHDLLQESLSNDSIDTKNIFNDFNLNQSSNYDKFNQEEKLQKETKEQKVENIETTFVRPQTRLEENRSNTFVRPETKLDTNSPSVNALGEKFVREKMARAINMTHDLLQESLSNDSIDTKNIFNDFNLNQSSNYDKFNQEEKLQKETKEQKVENISNTFIRPQTRLEENRSNTFIRPQTRLEENQSNTFVRPETKLDTNSPSVNALGEKFVREKMARAINMGLDNLNNVSVSTISSPKNIMQDFNLKNTDAYKNFNQEEKLHSDNTKLVEENNLNVETVTNSFVRPQTRLEASKENNKVVSEIFNNNNNFASQNTIKTPLPFNNIDTIFNDYNVNEKNINANLNSISSNKDISNEYKKNISIDYDNEVENLTLEADLKNILNLDGDNNIPLSNNEQNGFKMDNIENRINNIELILERLTNQTSNKEEFKEEFNVILNKLDNLNKELAEKSSYDTKKDPSILFKKYQYNKKRNH